MKRPVVVLSCEHGGRGVPAPYRRLFRGAGEALASHRGWDRGALTVAREMAAALDAPLVASTTTRLLADPNRSADHPEVFSEWTRGLSDGERSAILARWWRPHRERVEARVRAVIGRGATAVHLSIHSFTPVWKGRARDVDVGFLYDPARPRERAFATRWLEALRALRPDLRLRRNRPYFGSTDGLTTWLRTRFDRRRYLGLELEVSQRFPAGPAGEWRRLRRDLVAALEEALDPARAGT